MDDLSHTHTHKESSNCGTSQRQEEKICQYVTLAASDRTQHLLAQLEEDLLEG